MPLSSFRCSVCGAKAPEEYLEHGQFSNRMKWLRKHYKKKHPRLFKQWANNRS